MMSWSGTEGLDNVHDQMSRMIVWPSTESHDSTKVRLIGFDRLIGFQGNESHKNARDWTNDDGFWIFDMF